MVLVSKVNALMRRINSTEEYSSIMVCGDIELNCREMKVYQGGQEISLSKKEMQLLGECRADRIQGEYLGAYLGCGRAVCG